MPAVDTNSRRMSIPYSKDSTISAILTQNQCNQKFQNNRKSRQKVRGHKPKSQERSLPKKYREIEWPLSISLGIHRGQV